MNKIFDSIKSAYESKVLSDYFVVEFNTFKVVFAYDGNWFMKVDAGGKEYVYSCMFSNGRKLTDSDFEKCSEILSGMIK